VEELIPIDVNCFPAEKGQRYDLCGSGTLRGNRRGEEVVVGMPDGRTTQRGTPSRTAEIWRQHCGLTATAGLALPGSRHACRDGKHGVVLETRIHVLEDAVKVYLANPREVKNRKGHKTDDKDGWWLAHLLRHAMIHPSFIPPRSIRELRDLTRRRERLNGAGTAEKNRVQKILEDAKVKLGNIAHEVYRRANRRD